jgi:hypothetical protein
MQYKYIYKYVYVFQRAKISQIHHSAVSITGSTIVVNSVPELAIPAGMPRAAACTGTQDAKSRTSENSGHLGSFRPFRPESKFRLCRYRWAHEHRPRAPRRCGPPRCSRPSGHLCTNFLCSTSRWPRSRPTTVGSFLSSFSLISITGVFWIFS